MLGPKGRAAPIAHQHRADVEEEGKKQKVKVAKFWRSRAWAMRLLMYSATMPHQDLACEGGRQLTRNQVAASSDITNSHGELIPRIGIDAGAESF